MGRKKMINEQRSIFNTHCRILNGKTQCRKQPIADSLLPIAFIIPLQSVVRVGGYRPKEGARSKYPFAR